MRRRTFASLRQACRAVLESLESRCLLSGHTLSPNNESIFRAKLESGEYSAYRFELNEPLVLSAKLRDATGDARLRLVKPNGRVIRMGDTIRKPLGPGKYRITVKNHDETDLTFKLRLQAARGEQLDSPERLTAHVYSGTDLSLDWVDQSNGERGYRIQQSIAGGNFQTIACVKGNVTKTYIDGLTPSTIYQFRVRAIGDQNTFSSDLEVSDVVLTSEEDLSGWYKVTDLDYKEKGEAGYNASDNTLHIENDGWVFAPSWQRAVWLAVEGGLKIVDTNHPYVFEDDGAFSIDDAAVLDATKSEFDISPSAGKIIVLEDCYETPFIDRDYDDFYWKVDVVGPVSFVLKEVYYTATDTDRFYSVEKDDGTGAYSGPHWQDNSSPLDGDADDSGDKKYPVAYRREATMEVVARFDYTLPSGMDPLDAPKREDVEIV